MTYPEPGFFVKVDMSNPGQFFACCGLLELAHRLWPGAEGWFEDDRFRVRANHGTGDPLPEVLQALNISEMIQLDPEDDYSSPIGIGPPLNLRLDWWLDELAGGKQLKTWAGSMRNVCIAQAMRDALSIILPQDCTNLFSDEYRQVVFESNRSDKKVEPFYFDSRRGSNAQSLDIGFTPDALEMTTLAHPTIELLCLVGLQRCRPATTDVVRIFDYLTWSAPVLCSIMPAAVCGMVRNMRGQRYRFEVAFRTGQKKHKAFLHGIPIGGQT